MPATRAVPGVKNRQGKPLGTGTSSNKRKADRLARFGPGSALTKEGWSSPSRPSKQGPKVKEKKRKRKRRRRRTLEIGSSRTSGGRRTTTTERRTGGGTRPGPPRPGKRRRRGGRRRKRKSGWKRKRGGRKRRRKKRKATTVAGLSSPGPGPADQSGTGGRRAGSRPRPAGTGAGRCPTRNSDDEEGPRNRVQQGSKHDDDELMDAAGAVVLREAPGRR